MLSSTSELVEAQTCKKRNPRTLSPADLTLIKEFENLAGSVLLDYQQVGVICGVALPTVKLWRYQGKGPPFRHINGRARISVAAFKQWLGALPPLE